jgi:Domain of unknown function (DUF3291)
VTSYHLAQLNIALPVEPLTSPRLAGFVAALDEINALADAAPGFVWRLQTEDGDATAVRGFDDDRLIVNMSLWTSIEALADYAYRSDHVTVLRHRREWFDAMGEAYQVLWWVPAGQLPTAADAEQRLAHLRTHGPTERAFTFRAPFPAPDAAESTATARDDWSCPV